MKLRNAPLTRKNRKSIALTFLLLLALPIFILSLLQNQNFDFRNKAFEDIEVSEINPCVITFPNVNPYSLEINSTVRVQVDGLSKSFGIKSLSISDNMGNLLISKQYDNTPERITESFSFTPQVAKAYNLIGSIKDTTDKAYGCVISSTYDVQGVRAITSNSKPVFTTTPKSSLPSQNIQTGVTYEYTLEAEDIDKDTINYSYSFTKDETWLRPTVIDDGGSGKLTIKFKGSTNKAGSYLANVFIHDGYSTHLSSQSWVISVSPKGNRNPSVRIIEPIESVRITENKSVKVTWEGEDDGEIIGYEIYISSNPTNQNSWKVINRNIKPTENTYSADFTNISDGTYRIIVKAVDNQTPAGVGIDISEEVIVAKSSSKPIEPDDKVILPEPQVINMSPTSADTLSNKLPTIKASLVATEGAVITESSIVMKLDNKDITQDIKINKISETEFTVIYIPTQALTTGLHKVDISFEDNKKSSTERSWSFTIQSEDEEQSGDNFNIFGLEIAKRTVYIILGGLGLIVLAIAIPMIIVAIWKDGSKDTETSNYALPQSLPTTTEIPTTQQQQQDLKELVKENFQAPEPQEVESVKQEIPEPILDGTTAEIPEPDQDLDSLYKQIEAIKDEDKNTPK